MKRRGRDSLSNEVRHSEQSETTLKSVRTPVDRTLCVLSVSAFHASTLETDLRFPSESL